MGKHHKYPMTSYLTSNINHHENDSIWSNPNELDLLDMKKSAMIKTNCHFLQVLPSIRKLYTSFDSLCPNMYRIHCSNSLRTLQEIICLAEEYLHLSPLSTISTNELLTNEKHFDDFLSKFQQSVIARTQIHPTQKMDIRCFGQGIQSYHPYNELNQSILFCFELTSSMRTNLSLPLDVIILDPDENLVTIDLQSISTYNQGHTKLFSCQYTPMNKAGIYRISFFHNNIKVINQQHMIFIRNPTSNYGSYQKKQSSLVEEIIKLPQQEVPHYELEGDGCSTKIIVNSIARFRLRLKSSYNTYQHPSVDSFSISILDPHGHTIVVQRRTLSPDLLELTYQPMSIGEHRLLVLFNNTIHRQVAIDVIQDELNFPSKLKPFGPGLKRAIVGLPTEFYVDLNQTLHPNIHFRLEPSYQAEIDYEQQMATVRYVPLTEGKCPIHILENDKDITNSPFIAHVDKSLSLRDKPRIRVVGLPKELMLHRTVEFQVFIDSPFDDSNRHLNVDILTDGKHSPSVFIRRRHRTSYVCSFTPVTLGKHFISVDYAGIVAEQNPFYSHAIQEKDILLSGPAMKNACVPLNQPTHFLFSLKDCLTTTLNEKNSTYESGYSSNDDISSKSSLSSSSTDIQTSANEDESNYRVTITDGHGNIKPNVLIKEFYDTKNENNMRVDFTPDEQILYINISCTCSTLFEPQSASTPKKFNTCAAFPNLCSTPRPAHIRWSLSKYTPRPVDSSTPQTRKVKKSAVPDLQRLIYPTAQSMKIWLL
ncbi:unnamed protein product [Adineta ricciae]|uniref:Uncharacterized protein n=1 Tax=Adineta ricciae TaxID=249248 RepID=A0A813UC42_ADIRI|nr:unnamed protein product [Adineta ricciae]